MNHLRRIWLCLVAPFTIRRRRHLLLMTALETLTASVNNSTAALTELAGAVNGAVGRINTPGASDAQLTALATIVDHNTEVARAQTAALNAALNPEPVVEAAPAANP